MEETEQGVQYSEETGGSLFESKLRGISDAALIFIGSQFRGGQRFLSRAERSRKKIVIASVAKKRRDRC